MSLNNVKEKLSKTGSMDKKELKDTLNTKAKELIANKPALYGTIAGVGLFTVTATGLMACIGAGVVVGTITKITE